jgi:acyl carrier protein
MLKASTQLKALKTISSKNINIFKSGIYNNPKLLFKNPVRFYHPIREMMKKRIPKYYSDPNAIGEEIIRIVSLHDKVSDPSIITIDSSFEEIGMDSIDFVEILLQIEYEIGYDFGASDWEQFITINDIAQFLAKDFYAQKH